MIVVFAKRAKWWEVPIQWWTGGPYYHCELMWADGTMFSAKPGEGTRFLHGHPPAAKDFDAFWIPTIPGTAADIRRACETEVGCAYDWWGLFFTQILWIPREDPDKWFCSEICAWALEHYGVIPQYAPYMLSPNALAKVLELHGAHRTSPGIALELERGCQR